MTRPARWTVGITLALVLGTAARTARADAVAPTRHLALNVGSVGVASEGQLGGATTVGVRYRPFRYFEVSVDYAWGLMDGAHGPEDRWWLTLRAALVVPVGRVSFDVGAGLGMGTVSGYDSWSAFFAAPFTPRWHLTQPEVRGHVGASIPLTGRWDLLVRAEAATMLISPQDTRDAVSYAVTVGFQGWVF